MMLDTDLAELYEIETKRLKEQVRRNIDRFPEDFMIELTPEEFQDLNELNEQKSRGKHSKYLPFAFTEHGVLMLASVLNSNKAIKVNIQIIKIFNHIRKFLSTNQEIINKLKDLEINDIEQEKKISLIFEYIKQLEQTKDQQINYENRKRIGYKV